MTKPILTLGLSLALLACGSPEQPETDGSDGADDRSRAIASVTGGEIRSHMEVLADDAMQGREAGTEFYEMAADYVIGEYKAIGLEPLGDGGSYLQSIQFLESRLVPESAKMSLHKGDDAVADEHQIRGDLLLGFSETAIADELVAEHERQRLVALVQ